MDCCLTVQGVEMQELLLLGAALDPADRNGSTPLFLACEQGQAGTAALLLRAGACPRAQNRAEERPLYIASLRGHASVVSELLRAMQSKGLPWQVVPAIIFPLLSPCTRAQGDAWAFQGKCIDMPLDQGRVTNPSEESTCSCLASFNLKAVQQACDKTRICWGSFLG